MAKYLDIEIFENFGIGRLFMLDDGTLVFMEKENPIDVKAREMVELGCLKQISSKEYESWQH